MKTELSYFLELTRVPRPSYHLEKIKEYLKNYAKSHNIFCIEDESGNILMRKGTPTVTLQAHMDMVPVSTHPFDFTTEPLETIVENGWIRANGTTLGADDGAGIAVMLSLMERVSDVECLFTSDEETNMLGASGLAEDLLVGKYLLNLDHENMDSILIGCAGGMNTDAFFMPEYGEVIGEWYTLRLSGLKSGHYGLQIIFNRANAIQLAAEFLKNQNNMVLADFKGGSKSNVIPGEAEVVFSSSSGISAEEFMKKIQTEYPEETTIKITVTKRESPKTAWTEAFSRKFIDTLLAVPNGIFEKDEHGVVTSSNLAIVTEENKKLLVATLQRSATTIADAVKMVTDVFTKSGASVVNYGNYPGWLLSADSPLLKIATDTYVKVFGHSPVIQTTHGGVECGIIQEKYPDMQVISLGPTVENVHTVNERMDISTLEMVGTFIEALMEQLA